MKRCRLAVAALLLAAAAPAQRWGGELRFAIRSDPKTFDPALVEDEASEIVRYLTGGVLLRLNRRTQTVEPELAVKWQISPDGRRVTFDLRAGVAFSDGTPFTAEHVAFTMQRLMDPALASATGDAFRSSAGQVRVQVLSPLRVAIAFPAPVADMARIFDQVAIVKAKPSGSANPGLGPFVVASYRPGAEVLLARNPRYWKTSNGKRLPYLDAIRLYVQQNRDLEFDRFMRREIDLIAALEPRHFRTLRESMPGAAVDAGPSLESEMVWFNQAPHAPLPAFKKQWFASAAFRRAVSEAIDRADVCRLVYLQYAAPATGPVSPANRQWFAPPPKPQGFDAKAALARLHAAGFRSAGSELRDAAGNRVEFSIVTNAGNTVRSRIATMIQQDLARIGIKVGVVALDFPSLIARITQSFDYEACLLGMVNIDLDPNGQMNVWLSAGANHPWFPKQPKPATAWEAEIDRLMRLQAQSIDLKKRYEAFAGVQRIVAEQAPVINIANHHALCAVGPRVRGAQPVPLTPRTFWNVERLWIAE